MGYLGGGLLFAIDVAMMLRPALFGLADVTEAARAAFVTVALWWAVFTVPLLLFVREAPARIRESGRANLAAGVRRITTTFHELREFRVVVLFLIAYWLYLDGVATIARMAVDYGMALGLDEKHLITALLITQFVGFPAAIAFGRLGSRIGPKPGIYLGIAGYFVAIVWSYFMRSTWEFYVLAIIVGLVQGGVQALSRSLFARLAPRGRSAEFFGFLTMSGRFAAIAGPLLVGVTALATGSSRSSVLVIAALFVAGAFVLSLVDEDDGARVALEHDNAIAIENRLT
jgi:UMF1 family MFS transporter